MQNEYLYAESYYKLLIVNVIRTILTGTKNETYFVF